MVSKSCAAFMALAKVDSMDFGSKRSKRQGIAEPGLSQSLEAKMATESRIPWPALLALRSEHIKVIVQTFWESSIWEVWTAPGASETTPKGLVLGRPGGRWGDTFWNCFWCNRGHPDPKSMILKRFS